MKRKYVRILLTSIFCSLAVTANAFDYTSREGGFSVSIPDQNIIVVGENIFAVENRTFDVEKQIVKTNGIHVVTCLTAEQLQSNFDKAFTTDIFNADISNIKQLLKHTPNTLADDNYRYLLQTVTGAYINYDNQTDNMNELVKLNDQLSKASEIKKITVEDINGRKALKVENEFKNIGLNLKLPMRKSEKLEQSIFREQCNPVESNGMKFDFSDDGYLIMQCDNLYSIKEITYLLSVNDNLYAVTSLYPSIKSAAEMEDVYKLDHKGFVKLNKKLAHNLIFTEGKPSNDTLVIHDKVAGRNLTLPPQWLYTKTDLASMYDMKEKGIQLTAYNALPEASIQAANDAMQTFGVSFDAKTNTLKMDLSQFSMHDLLNFVDEGVFMVSGNINSLTQLDPDLAPYMNEYKNFFNMPDLTKIIVNQTINHLRNIITPEKAAAMEKYIKAENFAYDFDINHYNGRFNCDADVKVHLPDIFKALGRDDIFAQANADSPLTEEESSKAAEDLVLSMMNENLIPFDCYVKNQLYFNRSRHFNNLLYFTKGTQETANKQILQQFSQSDLYIY